MCEYIFISNQNVLIGLNIYIIGCWIIESMSSLNIFQELVCINFAYNFVSIMCIESKHIHSIWISMLNLNINVQPMCIKFVYNFASINVCWVFVCWVYLYGFFCVKFVYVNLFGSIYAGLLLIHVVSWIYVHYEPSWFVVNQICLYVYIMNCLCVVNLSMSKIRIVSHFIVESSLS
jgi:hypothetical protein